MYSRDLLALFVCLLVCLFTAHNKISGQAIQSFTKRVRTPWKHQTWESRQRLFIKIQICNLNHYTPSLFTDQQKSYIFPCLYLLVGGYQRLVLKAQGIFTCAILELWFPLSTFPFFSLFSLLSSPFFLWYVSQNLCSKNLHRSSHQMQTPRDQ